MTDEAAVLLRISLFGLLAGVIYWSVSYEPLGTVGFLLLGSRARLRRPVPAGQPAQAA